MPAYYDVDSGRPPSQGPGLLTAIGRHPFVFIASVIIAAAAGVLATLALPTHYTAASQIVIGDQNAATVFRNTPTLSGTAMAQNAAQLMRSPAVHGRASEILNHRLSPSQVSRAVTVTPSDRSAFVTVSATEDSAKLARDVANAEGQAYLDVSRIQIADRSARTVAALKRTQAQLQAQVASANTQADSRASQIQNSASAASIVAPADRARYVQAALGGDPKYQNLRTQLSGLQSSLSTIRQKIQETGIDASLVGKGVDSLYPATTPADSRSSNMKRNVVLATALGLLIGAALAWRRLDRQRGVDHEQIAVTLGAPLLGRVKRDRELRNPARIVDLSPGRRLPDDLRVLASSLMLHMRSNGLAATVITSAQPGEGKTVIALNLAAAASSAGHDVVLIDGDVRGASLTEALRMERVPGLIDLLAGASVEADFSQLTYAPNRALSVIPVGSSRADDEPPITGLPVLRRPDGTTPAAIVDSPAILEDPVTLWLASGAAGLVVVVSAASTLDDLRTLRARAELAGVPILGFIVNEHRPSARKMHGRTEPHRRHDREPAAIEVARSPAPTR